jgi:sec-independent protein translocase protein TatA
MIPNIGGAELVIALVIILLLFGAKRIPELAKGLGSGVREFRKGTRGDHEVDEVDEDEEKKKEEELTAAEEKPETRAENASSGDATAEADRAQEKRS